MRPWCNFDFVSVCSLYPQGTPPCPISRLSNNFEINRRLFHPVWYRSYLEYRTVTVNHEGVKVKRFLARSTPQGGVLLPLAWNIAFESLLQTFSKGQVKICGFADDACLIATGESPLLLRFLMQEAIDKALAWGRSRGLQFSGPKTVAVLFTHKRVFRKPPPLKVGNTELPYSNHVRCLGVELDSKLY